jgi:hypothetical protein
LTGCDDLFDNDDHYFPLNDKYRIAFNAGEVLKYRNSLGDEFQLKIMESSIRTRKEGRKGSSLKPPYDIYEYQLVIYDSVFKNLRTKDTQGIYTQNPYRSVVVWKNNLVYYNLNSIPTQTMVLNGATYLDVFVFLASATTTKSSNNIETWYYTYKYGFVGFKLKGGEYYNLIP